MAKAADQVEAKHQAIHELQLRLQAHLPALASRLGSQQFNAFQHDYFEFDSEIERVKEGLDMVHASLTGQAPLSSTPARKERLDPSPPVETPTRLPESVSRLADANAELNSLLDVLNSELSDGMADWDENARTAWRDAQASWAEADRRQHAIMNSLPDTLRRAQGLP